MATITIDFDLVTMRVQESFSGLSGDVTAAHIHCCTAIPETGTAGVATVTPTFTGFPSGVTAVTSDHTFDMTAASSYNPAFVTANGGNISGAFNTLVAGLAAGTAYSNIHTDVYPGGGNTWLPACSTDSGARNLCNATRRSCHNKCSSASSSRLIQERPC